MKIKRKYIRLLLEKLKIRTAIHVEKIGYERKDL